LRDELDESTVGVIVRTGEPADAASRCFIDCLIETIRDESLTRAGVIRRAMQSVEVQVYGVCCRLRCVLSIKQKRHGPYGSRRLRS
jgi:hypothetical protein